MSDRQELKNKARKHYQGLDISTGSEGFPEASSFVYGFMEGYLLNQEKLDAAIEVTKFLSERLIHVYNESENLDYHIKARDFLKTRGE